MSTHKTYMIYNEQTYDLYELQWAHLQSMIYRPHYTYNLWFTMSTYKSINDNEHT